MDHYAEQAEDIEAVLKNNKIEIDEKEMVFQKKYTTRDISLHRLVKHGWIDAYDKEGDHVCDEDVKENEYKFRIRSGFNLKKQIKYFYDSWESYMEISSRSCGSYWNNYNLRLDVPHYMIKEGKLYKGNEPEYKQLKLIANIIDTLRTKAHYAHSEYLITVHPDNTVTRIEVKLEVKQLDYDLSKIDLFKNLPKEDFREFIKNKSFDEVLRSISGL